MNAPICCLAFAATLAAVASSHAAPPNDTCAAAQVVAAGSSTTGTNVLATSDILSTGCAFAPTDDLDVWYSFTPASSGQYLIDTVGSTTLEDTTLAVYSACGGSELFCNDDGDSGRRSVVLALLTGGINYRIRVAGFDHATGSFRLNVSTLIVAGGANFCTSATSAAASRTYSGDNSAATSDLASSSCGDFDNLDVWFTFSPATTANYNINTFGSPVLDDTTLAIFSSCGGTELFCGDDTPFNYLSQINPLLSAGTAYKIRVAGYDGAIGPFLLTIGPAVALPTVPTNDTCASATIISSLPFTSTTNIAAANADIDRASCNAVGATNLPNGIWFRYTSPSNQSIQLDERSGLNTIFTVLTSTGACSGPFTEVACGFSSILNAVSGRTYYILLGSAAATPLPQPALIDFHIQTIVRPPNDTCATATVITGSLTQDIDTSTAANENAEPDGTCNSVFAQGIDNSIWYTFIPPASGTLIGTISSAAADYDIIAVLYTGACGSLTERACFDNGFEPINLGLPDSGSAALVAGTQYRLAIGDYGDVDNGGDTQFNIIVTGVVPMGACCSGSTCTISSQGLCAGANRAFAGAATACNAFPANARTPCCLADFNHTGGLTVQDIFEFLGAYFTSSPFVDVNGIAGITVQDIFDYLTAYFGGCP